MKASELKSDIAANIEELRRIATATVPFEDGADPAARVLMVSTPGELALLSHLQNTLWPFLDGLVDKLKEQDETLDAHEGGLEELGEVVDDLTEERGSVLMPNEAAVFSLVVQLSRAVVAKLEAGHQPTQADLDGMKLACDAAEKVLVDTVINVDVDGDDEGDEDDDEGDEDDDD